MECQLKLRGDVSPKPSYKEGFGETSAGKVTIHGCGLPDSRTPGLPDSRTPGLPKSRTARFLDSLEMKGCVVEGLLIFFRWNIWPIWVAKLSFRNLRKDNNFADVTLACEDRQQVEAHTAILAGQVLANKLYHRYYNINTTNINTDDININDRSTFSDEGPKQLISSNHSWMWSWGIPHNILTLIMRFRVPPILVQLQGSPNWPNYDRKWSLEEIWNGSIRLEGLMVWDMIKSKLGLVHCSPNLVHFINPICTRDFGSYMTRGGGADFPPPSKNGCYGWEVQKLSWNLISYQNWCQTWGFTTFRNLEPPELMVWKSDFFSQSMRFVRVPPYEIWANWTNFCRSWENGDFSEGQKCCILFHTQNEEK